MSTTQIAHNLDDKKRTKDVLLDASVSFDSLLLSDHILQGLTKNGFRKPSPIQLKAIPIGRCGFDLIVKSKSGTGKTAIFTIIALEMVNVKWGTLQAMMIAPTREIAVQIQDVLRSIGSEMEGLKVESFIGGMPLKDDNEKAKNCHIAVGAPGRLRHLIKNGVLNPQHVKLFVLDEADKLLESSFKNDINEIFEALPERKQMLAMSATYENDLVEFLKNYMLSPTYITVDVESPILLGLRHFMIVVKNSPNAVLLMKAKNDELQNILSNVRYTQCLIFSNYQTRAESISNFVNKNGWSGNFISAVQSQVHRLKVIEDFKKISLRILSSTDLTARGIDASGVDLVINYDIPPDAMTYLHRMGRAGRYGSEGICINLVSEGAEMDRFLNILGTIGGTSLSAPVLKCLEIDTDLRKIDLSSLEHRYGKISSKPDTDVKSNLIKEVFSIKQSTIPFEKKSTKNSKAKNKSKQPAKRVKELDDTEDKNIANILNCSKSESCDSNSVPDMDCQLILQSLAEGKTDVFKSDSDETHDYKKETSDISDPDCQTVLQQLAEGKTDILMNNLQEMDTSDGNDLSEELRKRKRDSTETLSTDSNQDSDEDKRKFEEASYRKNIALLSTTKLLASGPSGNVEQDIVGSIDEYLKALKEKDFAENETCLKSEENRIDPRLTENIVNADVDTHSVEEENAAEIPDDLFSVAYESLVTDGSNYWTKCIPKSEILACQEFHFEEENLRLPEVEQTYFEEEEEIYEEEYMDEDEEFEDADDVDEEERNKKHVEIDEEAEMAMQPTLEWVPVTETESKTTHSSYHTVLYQAGQCSSVDDSCEKVLHQKDHNSDDQEQARVATKAHEYQFYQAGDCVEAPKAETEMITDYNHDDHFMETYQACSDQLWNNGLNFRNLNDFDEWFHQWQNQVRNVRDYVQQNIYLDEMNRYRYHHSRKY